jgi:hypothetical protein
MRSLVNSFFAWYERHYRINIAIASGLFALQIIHLIWLTGQPVAEKATGDALFTLDGPLQWLIILVDYTEIPALLSVSLVYINELRKRFDVKHLAFLIFLNSQYLHIFWITDEFVVATNEGESTALPPWLAWAAILIDYLELPVIFDTLKKLAVSIRERSVGKFLREDLVEAD